MSFECIVNVNRLEDIGRFSADVTIRCSDCGTRFQFLGLKAGLDLDSPTVSVNWLEARMPIAPMGEVLTELQGTPRGYSIRKTK